MSNGTKIEWTDETWNPLRGCTKVSAGCANCYAESVAARFGGPGQPYEGTINYRSKVSGLYYRDPKAAGDHTSAWSGEIKLVEEKLVEPLRWTKPRMVFVNSMSDLFHEAVPAEFIDRVFAVMALAENHTFQVLTKRPERMREYLTMSAAARIGGWDRQDRVRLAAEKIDEERVFFQDAGLTWPLPNVWLGVSVENQETADERIPLLLETPAAVRFVSCEPLIGPVDLRALRNGIEITNCLAGRSYSPPAGCSHENHLDWVIVGGESGPKARPMHPDWARSLRDQCQAAQVPFLFKQWGEWAPDCLCATKQAHRATKRPEQGILGCMFRCGKKAAGRELDGRTWDEYPEPRS